MRVFDDCLIRSGRFNSPLITAFKLVGVFLPNEYMKEYPIVVLVQVDSCTVSGGLSSVLQL